MCTALAAREPAAAAPAPLTGQSACNLVEGVPAAGHPIRQHKALAAAFKAVERAGFDAPKNSRAHDALVKTLDRMLAAAVPAFKAPASGERFAPAAAQRFLGSYVLAANAPLRVGLERFEPAPEVLAALTLTACRAGRVDDVVALARASTLPESAPQRAFAALLLIEAGRADEARELAPYLGADGFLAPYVRAELATDPAERAAQHTLAGQRRVTPDQDLAWRTQAQRP